MSRTGRADSPVSIVGGGRIAGETASEADFPMTEKLVFLLMLVAGFNLFIGLFNFIPLLPLDGGHIAGALWEAIRRGVARAARSSRPRATSTSPGCCPSRTASPRCCSSWASS